MFTSPLRYYDRSRTTTDWACPRMRYWQYEHRGKGIVSEKDALAPYIGTAIHDAMAAIATFHQTGQGVDIDLIATTAFKQVYEGIIGVSEGEPTEDAKEFASEQGALVEGLVRGFYKQMWPSLIAQYPILVAIEQEVAFRHNAAGLSDPDGQFMFMSRPDLVLANDAGEVTYVEYKTTSSKKEGWVNSWSTAVQLHSTIRAVEQTLGVTINQVIIQGLYKGFESYGKQSSPFCYAYARGGQPPFTSEQISYVYKPGFKRTPTWTLPGGVKAWVEGMPPELLSDQFPQTPPIMIKDHLVEEFFAQCATREQEIEMAMELMTPENEREILNLTFKQHFDQCQSYYGKDCAYKRICHGSVENPLEQGFTWRTPHHTPEQEAQDGQEATMDVL